MKLIIASWLKGMFVDLMGKRSRMWMFLSKTRKFHMAKL